MFKETDQNDYELRKKELDEYILNSQLCIKELADYISSSVMTLDVDELSRIIPSMPSLGVQGDQEKSQ